MLDETHDPALKSWVASANGHPDFPIQNLPLGVFRRSSDERPRIGVAIGDEILDLSGWLLDAATLKGYMGLPASQRRELRRKISKRLSDPSAKTELDSQAEVEMLMPVEIGDYTDFYASLHHATNVGKMLRPDQPLFPNYKWVPIAYHGRASSVVVSGTHVRRPQGQLGAGVFGPSKSIDYELELGAFLGPGTNLGEPVPIDEADEYLVGVCLLNDWSARDIQKWEYQPLGPFLAKNFATSISPWVVTIEALEPFRCALEPRAEGDPEPLPYLRATRDGGFDLKLEVWVKSARMSEPMLVSRGEFRQMYWTLAQMIAHHTSNGCPLRAGDLIGSGTVSGPEPGCLLERGGLTLPDGEERRFLADGDEVILRGYAERVGAVRIGLGECRGRLNPAA